MRKISLLASFCLIFAITFAVTSGNACATQNWQLIYSNNASGNPTYGSIDDLRDAILLGADVKIVFHHGNDTALVGNMGATVFSSGLVTLYGTGTVDCPGGVVHYLDRLSTSGLRQVTMEANTCGKASSSNYYPMDWYVSSQDWELIYSNDASGNPTYGNKADLKDAILSGADMKIVYHHGDDTSFIGNMGATIFSSGLVTFYGTGLVDCPGSVVRYLDRLSTSGLHQENVEANTCGKTSSSNYYPMDWYISR